MTYLPFDLSVGHVESEDGLVGAGVAGVARLDVQVQLLLKQLLILLLLFVSLQVINVSFLASLDSSESAKLIYWVYVGQMTSVVVSSS